MSIFSRIFQGFLILFFLFFFTVNVQAVENTDKDGIPDAGLQISPTKFIWNLKDGEQKTSTINVKNYSDTAQKVIIEVEDFYVGEDGSEPLFFIPDNDHPRKNQDVIKWITPPDNFVLEAGKSKNVDFTVRVPKGQPTNGYYGSIFFKAVTANKKTNDKNVSMGIEYRIGSLVIMTVQGNEPVKTEGELKEFSPVKKIFWNQSAKMTVKMINTGNIHYPMYGKIKINKFSKKFHTIELKPQLVYPNKIKEYREDMKFDLWDFGIYTANLSMWSYDKSVKFNKQISFLIIPWKGLAIIGGSIFLLGMFKLWIKK